MNVFRINCIEIEKIYKREVVVLPTARTLIRDDLSDLVYKDEFTKWKIIATQCEESYRFLRRPILIGTTSIEKSEKISTFLPLPLDENQWDKLFVIFVTKNGYSYSGKWKNGKMDNFIICCLYDWLCLLLDG
mgnify:CR=1 FL=1